IWHLPIHENAERPRKSRVLVWSDDARRWALGLPRPHIEPRHGPLKGQLNGSVYYNGARRVAAPYRSRHIVVALLRANHMMSAVGRLCCKSRKLQGRKFFAK